MQKLATPRTEAFTSGCLAGKAAIVTGSTSGIGLGIARAFAEAGMDVMFNGLGASNVDDVRADIERAFGVATAYSGADMSKPDEIAAMFGDAIAQFGKVDVLVNNAGIQHVEAIETFPPAKWHQIIAIDLSAAFHHLS